MSAPGQSTRIEELRPEPIAIIGLGGRFPGADSPEALWAMLCAGVEAIQQIPLEALEDRADAATRNAPKFVAARGILEDADRFDAELFRMLPRDAELTDPQARVLLETVWSALENAGYAPRSARLDAGVFVGSSINSYLLAHLAETPGFLRELTETYQNGASAALLGNGPDFLATRISYALNLHGPAMTVQSACSTSLLAVAQACAALRAGQTAMAIAGGVSISFPQRRGYLYQPGAMLSPDGHCRPFDAGAAGTVFGAGAGAVVLKRQGDALRDGDHIYALITGVGLSNDGADKVGYAAPSAAGQTAAILMAHRDAGVDAATIEFVECHGTGTPLGDPIEVEALTRAFRASTDRRDFCTIGSLKGNVGHLDIAAGVTGLIKTTLALERGAIPGTLHFTEANPKLQLASSPFRLSAETTPWARVAEPRRAGVSAFGVGGTNVHLVLEEAPRPVLSSSTRSAHLLPFSGLSENAVRVAMAHVCARVAADPAISLADVAFTLATGREAFPFRATLVARTHSDLAEQQASVTVVEEVGRLAGAAVAPAPGRARRTSVPEVFFLFPGQGAQHAAMGAGLYRSELRYRQAFDLCDELLEPRLGLKLAELLYGDTAGAQAGDPLAETRLAQPALFAASYAIAQMWMAWGVRPAAMLGHSLGELVAACLAGVLTLEDALRAIVERGARMEVLAPGGMLAVHADPDHVLGILHAVPEVEIAAVNAPGTVVLSGPVGPLATAGALLHEAGLSHRSLSTARAFHSAMVDPVVAPLEALFAGCALHAPTVPIASSVTGAWLTAAEAVSPRYWARHCREQVRFADGLACLVARAEGAAPYALLECGPGSTLAGLARRQTPKSTPIFSTLPAPPEETSDDERTQTTLGALWRLAVPVDWAAVFAAEPRLRVPLPGYAFQRKRFWVPAAAPVSSGQPLAAPGTAEHDAPREPPSPPSSLPARPAAASHPGDDPMTPKTAAVIPKTNAGIPKTSAAIPKTTAAIRPAEDHVARLTGEVTDLLEELSGLGLTAEDGGSSFLELGLDSLFLTQLAARLQARYNVTIAFRQLLNELASPRLVAEFLSSRLPHEPGTAPDPLRSTDADLSPANLNGPVSPAPETRTSANAARPTQTAVAQLMEKQVEAMSELFRAQMQMLGAEAATPGGLEDARPSPPAAAIAAPSGSPADRNVSVPAAESTVVELRTSPRMRQAALAGGAPALTSQQTQFVEDLIGRYSARTAKSKVYTEQHRAALADPRAVTGFRKEWKEMTYNLVVDRANGSRLWDIDGNEYIDLVNGFGPTLFGHGPDFVVDAVKQQLDRSFAIGPQSPLAGETAELIAELTGTERVTFCNTGSEAVMLAMRLARAVTGREKVVYFAGDYHGQFDEVLVRGIRRNGEPVSLPGAPGIPLGSVGNVVVLEYGEPAALAYLEAHAPELAAVIVEPVQSRHPSLQPRAFLHEVRRITAASGTAFVFDEVVTGFRLAGGGAQAFYGVRADLASYGKVAGGGLPIGILAGTSRFMDALDGGTWRFGDASLPEVGMTFFAGTFVRHPLALAATHATLSHIRAAGDALYTDLNRTAERFAADAQQLFRELGVPFTLEHCGSIFYLAIPPEFRQAGLLFALLRERGVHAMEHFPLYLTTAHTDQDLAQILSVLRESIRDLQAVGFFPRDAAPMEPPHPSAPDVAPLTEPQREILMAAQMGPEASCAFNESCTLHLDGPLDRTRFVESWAKLVDRHVALRLTLSADGTAQRLAQQPSPAITELDWRADSAAAESVRHFLEHDASSAFDLERGPLVRATLIRLPGDQADQLDRHDFILTAHHIVLDGWSINLLMDELDTLYTAAVEGREPSLPPALSFVEYARAAALSGRSDARQRAEAFWREQLRELPAPLLLPRIGALGTGPAGTKRADTDATERTFAGDTLFVEWPEALTVKLRKAGAAMGCTLFVTLLGAWQMLLMRLAEADEAIVLVPSAAQAQLDHGHLIGHGVHLLPIRGGREEGEAAQTFLGRLKRRVLEAYEHNQVTFGSLVRLLEVPREPGRLPLSEIQFNLEKAPRPMVSGALRSTFRANPKKFVNFDLFLNIVDTPAGLRLECDFNTGLYSKQTLLAWLDCYRVLLEGVVLDARTPIAELPLLTPEQQIAELSLNLPAGTLPAGEETLVDCLRLQAAATPGAIAIEFYGQKLAYAELFRRSTRLARTLQLRGLGKGDLVGIYLTRSPEMVIALLAVLASGAAYVPLDPLYPTERLAAIVRETGMRLLLTSDDDAVALGELAVDLLLVDGLTRDDGLATGDELATDDRSQRGPERAAAVAPPLPEDTAYVIFTSGSTGKPKGVAVTNGNLLNALRGVAQTIGFDAGARLLAVTTLSFDIAALELLMPLLAGATLILARRDDTADGTRLHALLAASRATVMQATPITWRMLLAAGVARLPELTMLCGGERWDRQLADQLLSVGKALWNFYGPTETTIWSACEEVLPGDRAIAITHALPRQRLYLLDRNRQILAPGVLGELYIAGDGVAKGYFERPELTAQRFVEDPFSARPGARMYRTGDRARRTGDGRIEILGRIDDQIKLRGFRVEPGEIEAALRVLPGVDQAFVALRNDRTGAPRLVAFLTAKPGFRPDAGEIREQLQRTLPEYMIPAVVLTLEELPLTDNGKVDRNRLPEPDFAAAAQTTAFRAPESPEQNRLAAIWCEVLGLDRVSIDQPLLSLGADSLHIFQIAARAAKADLPVTARHLMKLRTIEAICAELGGRRPSAETTVLQSAATIGLKRAPREQYRVSPGRAGGDSGRLGTDREDSIEKRAEPLVPSGA